jgi:hypothetical protein
MVKRVVKIEANATFCGSPDTAQQALLRFMRPLMNWHLNGASIGSPEELSGVYYMPTLSAYSRTDADLVDAVIRRKSLRYRLSDEAASPINFSSQSTMDLVFPKIPKVSAHRPVQAAPTADDEGAQAASSQASQPTTLRSTLKTNSSSRLSTRFAN